MTIAAAQSSSKKSQPSSKQLSDDKSPELSRRRNSLEGDKKAKNRASVEAEFTSCREEENKYGEEETEKFYQQYSQRKRYYERMRRKTYSKELAKLDRSPD